MEPRTFHDEEEPMIRRLSIAAAFIVALAWPGAARAQDVDKGKQVYESAAPKCKVCHSIGGVGNAKGSLDDAGQACRPRTSRPGSALPRR
jgi:cytochrome c5